MAALRGILDAFWTSELEQLVVAEPPKKGNPHDD
jgi:hypothetical protein